PQGIFIGRVYGSSDSYRKEDCGTADKVYVAGKGSRHNGYVWGYVEGSGFTGCGWLPIGRLTNRHRGKKAIDHAQAKCPGPPPIEPWQQRKAVYAGLSNSLYSSKFTPGHTTFCYLNLPQPRTFTYFENFGTKQHPRKVGNRLDAGSLFPEGKA